MNNNFSITCKICGCVVKSNWHLSNHIKQCHNISLEEYYVKYIDQNAGICKHCGNKTKFISIGLGFKQFCSLKCGRSSNITKEKRKNTCINHFGVTCNFSTQENKEKTKQTCLAKYNTEYACQSTQVKNKIKQTNNLKYGQDWYIQTDDFKDKTKAHNIKKYGVEYYQQTEEYKNKVNKTSLMKYDAESYLCSKIAREKFKEIYNKKYNCDYPSQNVNIKNKIKNTWLSRYNGIGFASNKCKGKYYYCNQFFDSSWELAYYIWLTDNNIDFIYHPNIYFKYIDTNGVERLYFPDFYVNGKYIEIKGDFLIKENTIYTMDINKYECIKNNAVILLRNDIKKYILYVKMTYGNDFLTTKKVKKI